MGNLVDLTSQRFGTWTVLEKGYTRSSELYWKCRCSCGTEKFVKGASLRQNKSLSCGCEWYSKFSKKVHTGARTHHRRVYDTYLRNAKSRSIDFNIELIDFIKLIEQNCYYCNCVPSNYSQIKKAKLHPDYAKTNGYAYNGLDRVDSSKGYTLDNVVPCCKKCNFMKKEYETEDFLEHIRKIILNVDNRRES